MAELGSARVHNLERGEQAPVEAPITRQQPCRMHLRVSAHQEVRQNARALAALHAVLTPDPARQKQRLAAQRLQI